MLEVIHVVVVGPILWGDGIRAFSSLLLITFYIDIAFRHVSFVPNLQNKTTFSFCKSPYLIFVVFVALFRSNHVGNGIVSVDDSIGPRYQGRESVCEVRMSDSLFY